MARRKPTYSRVAPVFPRDFPERLERLKEASGQSWHQMARELGTDPGVIREWRTGNKQPASVYLFALFLFAGTVSGGSELLLTGEFGCSTTP